MPHRLTQVPTNTPGQLAGNLVRVFWFLVEFSAFCDVMHVEARAASFQGDFRFPDMLLALLECGS